MEPASAGHASSARGGPHDDAALGSHWYSVQYTNCTAWGVLALARFAILARSIRCSPTGRWATFVLWGAAFIVLIVAARGGGAAYYAVALPLSVGLTALLTLPTCPAPGSSSLPAEITQPAVSRNRASDPEPSSRSVAAPGDRCGNGPLRSGNELAATILSIIESSLPILSTGLGPASAAELVHVLFRDLDFDAIAITDTERILAFKGVESEHHLPGDAIATEATRVALRDRRVTVARSRAEVQCSHPGCRLAGGVIAPLMVSREAVGSIKFYRTAPDVMTNDDETLAAGLSRLLSSQLEIYEVEVQRQLAGEAQVRALKAQIHPHFIFNVLNTISSACVVDPQVARTVVLRLSSLLRRTFRIRSELITLQEELALVREYLEIESIRFPDMISYHEEVDSEIMRCLVPVLILQPLVENCIIHGLRGNHIHLILRACLDGDQIRLEVEDDGPGLSDDELARMLDSDWESPEGVGIRNTRYRLQALAGEHSGLCVENRNPGLRVVLRLPMARETMPAMPVLTPDRFPWRERADTERAGR